MLRSVSRIQRPSRLVVPTGRRHMAVSVDLIKQLRQDTGAPLGQCKTALNETSGDIKKAKDWLREKGISSAAKKSGRRAADGLAGVAVSADGRTGCVVEVNSETDFVARNDQFQKLVSQISHAVMDHASSSSSSSLSLDAAQAGEATIRETGVRVDAAVKEAVGVIGENLQLRRAQAMRATKEGSVLVPYVHNAAAPEMGKIAALVLLHPTRETMTQDRLKELGTHMAMHVTASAPQYLRREDVPEDVVTKEREILEKQSPDNTRAVEGRLRKFLGEIVLPEQPWLMDQKKTVAQVLKEEGAEVEDFARFAVGEGL
eukprot:gb/GECH01009478.1/.p1 GENE.gb/GECH01009478.1/~~gb/GECH01009478.1/.p1  ORF type:complete len:316 (+),score=75.90 gb/GECH01009478.1/:1-948(+)